MVLIGAIKPLIPINSFLTTIYQNGSQLYVHRIIGSATVDAFEEVVVSTDDLILAKESRYLQIGDPALFGYLFEDGEVIFGTRKELFNRLKDFLVYQPKFVSEEPYFLAKAIVSSFYLLHGLTAVLIKEYNDIEPLHRIFVESFITTEESASTEDLRIFFSSGRDRTVAGYFPGWRDLIYIDNRQVYFQSKHFCVFKAVDTIINAPEWMIVEFILCVATSFMRNSLSEDTFRDLMNRQFNRIEPLLDHIVYEDPTFSACLDILNCELEQNF